MASSQTFTPDADVFVHKHGAIRQICAHFRSHEDGLPEWAKNSSDAYARADRDQNLSTILILLRDGKGAALPVVACLDFVGVSAADIEGKFRHWADPTAAGQDEGVQGGHGNGGKCYMTQLFDDRSYLHSCLNGRGNRYGFVGGDPTPGYFPSPDVGRDYEVADPEAELASALTTFNLALSDLPVSAREAWEASQSFTLVVGVGAKGLKKNRIPAVAWANGLAGHQQMVAVLRRCSTYVIHNGKALEDAAPLSLPEIDPIAGAEAARIVPVPSEIPDPATGEMVDTGAVDLSRLELRTSSKTMRHAKRQARHTVAGWTLAGRSTGYWEVPAISSAAYSNQIYGDVFLDALDHYRQNDRRHHSEGPLSRALRAWISLQIQAYSDEFAELDRLHATEEQRDELSRLNQALNAWKDEFLREEFGKGEGGGDDGDTPPVPPKLPRGQVSQVVLRVTHQMCGSGVAFRPQVEFLDAAGSRVRAVPHEWRSTNEAVLSYDEALHMLVAGQPGLADLSVVCKDSGVASPLIGIEVLDIERIDLEPAEVTVAVGSRSAITPLVRVSDGRKVSGVYLTWTEDNPSIASVGSGGTVYGVSIGQSGVTAGDDNCLAAEAARINVVAAEDAGDRGGGFPTILLSEIDNDPLGETPPVFSAGDPPVYQRPQDVDANIWWINMASPLARRYVDTGTGGGIHSREWRVYHLERYIEVMIKIILTYSFRDGEVLTFETMLSRWEAEATLMQQRAADTLSTFLEGGDVVAKAA